MDGIRQINLMAHQLNEWHLMTWWMPFHWVKCICWVNGCHPSSQWMSSVELKDAILLTWLNRCHSVNLSPSIKLTDAVLSTQWMLCIELIQWSVDLTDAIHQLDRCCSIESSASVELMDAVHWVNRCRQLSWQMSFSWINGCCPLN